MGSIDLDRMIAYLEAESKRYGQQIDDAKQKKDAAEYGSEPYRDASRDFYLATGADLALHKVLIDILRDTLG